MGSASCVDAPSRRSYGPRPMQVGIVRGGTEPGDMTILGVRTVEGFGVMVDNIGHRFVSTPTIVTALKKMQFQPDTTIPRGLPTELGA